MDPIERCPNNGFKWFVIIDWSRSTDELRLAVPAASHWLATLENGTSASAGSIQPPRRMSVSTLDRNALASAFAL
jgi:hypothetical protein